ncbi:hypothetical protein J437_LFUL016931 [Ladona fulva]|uniref:Uncharacterized protein n=1 Tax=Ladona fulva TaxID=123851 RepID=A0A8K0PCI6_LADFU|nr:hypothetical protein J437_LFUL016931 [Ladona fulva]
MRPPLRLHCPHRRRIRWNPAPHRFAPRPRRCRPCGAPRRSRGSRSRCPSCRRSRCCRWPCPCWRAPWRPGAPRPSGAPPHRRLRILLRHHLSDAREQNPKNRFIRSKPAL